MPKTKSALMWLSLLSLVSAAHASGTVDLCARDDEPGPGMNLDRALAGGGQVNFACRPGASIRITKNHEITQSTSVDGARIVTLDAHRQSVQMFVIGTPGVTFELRNIALQGGGPPRPSRIGVTKCHGSVIAASSEHGRLILDHVTVTASNNAVYVCRDTAFDIKSGAFLANDGSALLTSDAATGRIADSRFTGNEHGISSGSSAAVVIYKGSFQNHTASAVDVRRTTGDLQIQHSLFTANRGNVGAAIHVSGRSGTVLVNDTEFRYNQAASSGGAIGIERFVLTAPIDPNIVLTWPAVRLRVTNATFIGNGAPVGGAFAANLEDGGSVHVVRGFFAENFAQLQGGAISIAGPEPRAPGQRLRRNARLPGIHVAGSIFRRNEAPDGAAMYVRSSTRTPTVVANSLIVENRAQAGAALSGGEFLLANTTVARNAGAGINAASWPQGRARLRNSIVAENSAGNCVGVAARYAVDAASMQFPASTGCPGALESDPLLDELYAPLNGSPVIAASTDTSCFEPPVDGRDIYFQFRPRIGKCSLGAVEFFPRKIVAREFRSKVKEQWPATEPVKQHDDASAASGSPMAKRAVLAALAADAAAGPKRIHLNLESHGRTVEQTLEIVPPDRAHVVLRIDGTIDEYYYIGHRLYVFVAGRWRSAERSIFPLDARAHTQEFFDGTLVSVQPAVAQTLNGRTLDSYRADMRWNLRGTASSGQGDILVDTSTGLPASISFQGTCGTFSCRFTQTWDYETGITVSSPSEQ